MAHSPWNGSSSFQSFLHNSIPMRQVEEDIRASGHATRSIVIPESDPNEQDVDALLAQEMNQMSLHERERIYEEVHGVHEPPEETTEFVNKSLEEIEVAIEAIRPSDKQAYLEALEMKPEFCRDDNFRLMFLRREYFDALLAAERLVKYMSSVKTLFGPAAMVRPLEIGDLDADDLAFFASGAVQLLPGRDRAGRPIVFECIPVVGKQYRRVENVLKVAFYFLTTVVWDDVEAQRKGVTCVLYYLSENYYLDREAAYTVPGALKTCIPARMTFHVLCKDSPVIRMLALIFRKQLARGTRARWRLYYGSHTECVYQLVSFGIPFHLIGTAVSNDGRIKTANVEEWLARKQTIEKRWHQQQSTQDLIELPRNLDVCCGRGKTIQGHTGNLHMRAIVASMTDQFDVARYGQKNDITMKVIASIHEQGGRFLKQRSNDGLWVEVSYEEAVEKVSHAFRTQRLRDIQESRIQRADVAEHKRLKVSQEEVPFLNFSCCNS